MPTHSSDDVDVVVKLVQSLDDNLGEFLSGVRSYYDFCEMQRAIVKVLAGCAPETKEAVLDILRKRRAT